MNPIHVLLGNRVAVWAAALTLVPVLLVSVLLWRAFSDQADDNYAKRLAANLSLFEVVIDHSLDDFARTLSRLAADNTLQVTVDLDIRPQLKRYLRSQYNVSELDFIVVSDLAGEPLAVVGERSDAIASCQLHGVEQSEAVSLSEDRLVVVRALPLLYKKRQLGRLCGGYALNGVTASEKILARVDGLMFLGWQQSVLSVGGKAPPIVLGDRLGEVFATDIGRNHYRGMSRSILVAGEEIRLSTLVDTNRFEAALVKSLGIIGFVVASVLVGTLFGLKMLGLRKRAEEQLQVEREKAVVTLASIADGVVTTDSHGCITYINPAAEGLLDSSVSELSGMHLDEAFELRSESSGERIRDIEQCNTSTGEMDSVLIGRSGRQTHVHFSLAPIIHDNLQTGQVITFRDVHRERELRRRLAWQASRDDLTGLLNRSEFRNSLGAAMVETDAANDQHCLLYIDLDEFKIVNDTCGHRAGDQLLRQVSAGLLSLLRESDIVARLGGDEFGVLLHKCDRARGIELAETIIDLINDKRFSCHDKVFHVGASIGLVSITKATENLEDLLSSVDAACYAAKEKGRNRVCVGEVDANLIQTRMEELTHASDIRQALKEDRFVLYQQSIASTASTCLRKEMHAEVLVRMIDQEGNLVVPGAFIPVAERNGLMQDIDRWIIRRLFEIEGDYLRSWRPVSDSDDAPAEFLYSINLSGTSLIDPTFLCFVKEELQRHGIVGGAVAFEITETQAITHLDKAVEFISVLKGLGCRFLLDDFGSGMSSFGYLKHLPVDYLKIDGLFVKDILSDPIDRTMVKLMNEIGHTMGLKTIAEYVENDGILEELAGMGVDMVQGYGIARPEPIIRQHRATDVAVT
jgi:diguanylate cyclase (GGDEF)-like protein/PAS domain S-box-containing protein